MFPNMYPKLLPRFFYDGIKLAVSWTPWFGEWLKSKAFACIGNGGNGSNGGNGQGPRRDDLVAKGS